ncbi:helix-turn-helix domain-containing protein [Actinomarinicola tropica]|uniref:Helix-turn-helix domain-containing protein n=1 Tax=Actinomarinicola tropica TaxID=2789776 RepID=A0A5Q2RAC6_9ACTN|nr:helix-turn-helix domain-containing protein [Actinomarinicola tropica]QGG93768.1 helix-turn-helix domain-containing protein [Actinomarinicola tropica]
MIDGDLGAFIRSRREAVAPEEVGLPRGTRRRTPGLRRAELATLAGISVDYLVRLEQGRDTNPSAQVLAALADALRLDEEDRDHLRVLSMCSHRDLCPSVPPPATEVRPAVRGILERLEPTPALVLNVVSDVLAWTSGYERIVGPLGILDAELPNLVRFTFTDRRARDAYPHWERVADEQVANLRAAGPPEEHASRFVDEMREIPEFAARWQARPVARKQSGTKVIVHPEVGELRLAFETMQLPDADDQRLVVYLPGDEATAAALDRLDGRRPGRLRVVPDAAAR